jgi:hypothetical protein
MAVDDAKAPTVVRGVYERVGDLCPSENVVTKCLFGWVSLWLLVMTVQAVRQRTYEDVYHLKRLAFFGVFKSQATVWPLSLVAIFTCTKVHNSLGLQERLRSVSPIWIDVKKFLCKPFADHGNAKEIDFFVEANIHVAIAGIA